MGQHAGAQVAEEQATHEELELVERLIPDEEMSPRTVEDVVALPSFLSKLKACEGYLGSFEEWQQIPITDKQGMEELFMRKLGDLGLGLSKTARESFHVPGRRSRRDCRRAEGWVARVGIALQADGLRLRRGKVAHDLRFE